MRSSVVFIAIAFVPFLSVNASAQEAVIAPDQLVASEVERVPTMIVVGNGSAAEAKPATGLDARTKTGTQKAGSQPAAGETLYLTGETTGNAKYDQMVAASAARNGVDARLMFAVMRQESGFNPHARSYKGATGLMQLMPGTARRFGVANILDPAQNIEGGARYLRFLLDMFDGDVKLALAGYNAGENAVVGAGYKIPRYRETQAYVRSISAKYGSNNASVPQIAQRGEPVAPQAIVLANANATRLSNNY